MPVSGTKLAGLVVAIALGMPVAANGQTLRWKHYLHPEKQTIKEFYDFYLAGVKDGLIAYSVGAHEKLMCLPQNTVVTNEQLDDIMKRWAEKQAANPNLDDMPIGLVALAALRKEYPCQ